MRIMPRYLSLIMLGAALAICLLALAAIVYYAPVNASVTMLAHGGQQADNLAGLAIGQRGDYTLIPRRNLHCQYTPSPATQDNCTTPLGEQELHLTVTYDSAAIWCFHRCEVAYAGEQSSCQAGNLTVNGPPYALLSETALPWSPALRRDIQLHNLLNNFSEAQWLVITLALALLLAGSVTWAACQFLRCETGVKATPAALGGLATLAGAFVAFNLAVWFANYVD